MLKKMLCMVIALALVITICGCSKATDTLSEQEKITDSTQTVTNKEMSLLYSHSDNINPYTSKTDANRQLSKLLYESLVKTDNNFEPSFSLAQSVQIEDKVCTVRLVDARFTDGSVVTADDVVYSYNTAKECSLYIPNFYEIVSVAATDPKTVVFTLSQNDPFFANLLTFPIIKSGTSSVQDSDGKEVPPIGSGRYKIVPNEEKLVRNEDYYGHKGAIKSIKLINSPDSASTTHYVEVGAVSMYYNDSENIVRMSAKKTEVNLNRLVYIGINDSYGSLATKEMRYAISSALNRDDICQTAYYNNAIAATGFFSPYFKATKSLQTIESKPNSKITVENLSKIGYNNMNSNGFYANSAGNNPVFTLLVNSENSSRVAAANLIATQCKTAGIQINVVSCTYEQYVQRLSSGSFQLYLGEIQLLDNMDMTQLVVPGGSAAYGVNNKTTTDTSPEQVEQGVSQQSPCKTILESYHNAKCSISDVAGTLLTEMPQIPICYLEGVLFYDSFIKGGVEASSNDIYFNFENYEF